MQKRRLIGLTWKEFYSNGTTILLATAFLAPLLLPSRALANPDVDVIENACSGKPAQQMDTEFSRRLEKLQSDFKEPAARINNPKAFVAALDDVIAHSEFAPILECPSKLRKMGYTFDVQFIDPADTSRWMSLEDHGQKVNLAFSLTKSVQRVLFVYIHEMTHACQLPEKLKYTPGSGDYARFDIFMEIEAFFVMHQAYKQFVAISPNLCTDKGAGSEKIQFKLKDAYVNFARQLEHGDFAQSVLHTYSDKYPERLSEFMDLTSPTYTYFDSVEDQSYQLHALDSRFKKLIARLPIPVTEVAP